MNCFLSVRDATVEGMASKENLVPDVITDRNGKVTTVYRKTAAKNVVKNIPVVPVSVNTDDEVRSELHADICSTLFIDEPGDQEMLSRIIGSYRSVFLQRISSAVKDEDYNFATAIAANVFGDASRTFLSECMVFLKQAGTDDMGEAGSLILSVHRLPQFREFNDFSKAPENVQRMVVDLMNLTRVMSELNYDFGSSRMPLDYVHQPHNGLAPYPVITDEALVNLALDGNTERMMEVIREYGTADASVIKGILNGITPSLAEGSL